MSKVFLGAGHGGKDPGACANGLRESDINLVVALAAKEELERHGVEVGISRTTNVDDTTAQEVAKCNAFGADLAVDCHVNAGGGKGFEIYQQQTGGYAAQSEKLSMCIEARVKEMGQTSRGIKGERSPNGGYVFGFLSGCKCPSLLCEAAFIDNAQDVKLINTEAKQKAFGVAYAKGILDYLELVVHDEEDGTTESSLTHICGNSQVTTEQLRAFLLKRNPNAPDYASIYLEEGAAEGIRGDIAFVQSCLETGYWRFGGNVKSEQNNFCGLGATGGGEPGCSFATSREGIRAQIQHLKAYASTDALNQECVDPRFKYVQRGIAPYVEWLGIPDNPQGKGWAAAQGYGGKVLALLEEVMKIPTEGQGNALEALQAEVDRLKSIIDEIAVSAAKL